MGTGGKDTNTPHTINEKKIEKKKSLAPRVGVSKETDLNVKPANAPKPRDEIDDLFSNLKHSIKKNGKQEIEKEKVTNCAILVQVAGRF